MWSRNQGPSVADHFVHVQLRPSALKQPGADHLKDLIDVSRSIEKVIRRRLIWYASRRRGLPPVERPAEKNLCEIADRIAGASGSCTQAELVGQRDHETLSGQQH